MPGKDCINRKKINKFKIEGYKQVNETVKWTFKFDTIKTNEIDIDPIWRGVDLRIIQSCYNETKVTRRNVMGSASAFRPKYGRCVNGTNSCVVGREKYFFHGRVGTELYIENKSICRDIGFNVSGNVLDCEEAGFVCKKTGFKITGDSIRDGNGDGVCSSGESCITIDIRKPTEIISDLDTPSLKGIRYK